ncbi:hypothetical protein EUX98_g881 [Antrodiella citrinella]|uniref:Uncharacterized protein n=1 Tax=Antrodiella citrinella TaxID=2447956 RepID=A0A4S4NBG1_9APHY|nr:hypothetical protein EUX98_g881 [Antrodiella citrinella]
MLTINADILTDGHGVSMSTLLRTKYLVVVAIKEVDVPPEEYIETMHINLSTLIIIAGSLFATANAALLPRNSEGCIDSAVGDFDTPPGENTRREVNGCIF